MFLSSTETTEAAIVISNARLNSKPRLNNVIIKPTHIENQDRGCPAVSLEGLLYSSGWNKKYPPSSVHSHPDGYRTTKDLESYRAEVRDTERRIDEIRSGTDHSMLKQWETVLAETHAMIPDSTSRLCSAMEELSTLIVSVDDLVKAISVPCSILFIKWLSRALTDFVTIFSFYSQTNRTVYRTTRRRNSLRSWTVQGQRSVTLNKRLSAKIVVCCCC